MCLSYHSDRKAHPRETANKHLQRTVAVLVVVIIALVIVVMRLAVKEPPAQPQATSVAGGATCGPGLGEE